MESRTGSSHETSPTSRANSPQSPALAEMFSQFSMRQTE
ncbi:Uncharacterised protein [Mycobacteroides abscessus subsp. abscessus]|nr:Uncharacterised protein [Mycobacteroides abscessus subsp. abscessus]SKU90711.1 Uncharacterised protein [Mycobacteroides abscessus subsp. abscessus]